MLFVALKPIAADLDVPRAVPSIAYSLLMLGSGIGGIAMGLWLDKRGIVEPVLFGSVMIALGALVASQSETRWGLYVANGLFIGLMGKAAMIAPLVANATRWFDRNRGLAVAIIASGQGFGGMIWPPVVRYMNDLVGWRDTYLYFACLALVTMLPLAFFLRARPPESPSAALRSATEDPGAAVLGHSPGFVQGLMWIAVVGCCAAMAMPIVHLVSHATDLGVERARAAEMLSLLFSAAFVSRLAFGMVADRIGGTRTLLIGSASQAIMLCAFAAVDSVSGLYVAAIAFGLGFAGIMPCYALMLRALFPVSQMGWRIAAQYLFAALGMALGGWLGGVVFDLSGSYSPAFMVGFAFNLVNLICIGYIYLRQRTRRAGLAWA
jgi:MFS family permease